VVVQHLALANRYDAIVILPRKTKDKCWVIQADALTQKEA
jgi:hypothetical protein